MSHLSDKRARSGPFVPLLRAGGALAVALALVACGGGEDRPWTGAGDPPWSGGGWTQTDSGGWIAPSSTEGYDWVDGKGWVYWGAQGGSEGKDPSVADCFDADNQPMPVRAKTITIHNNHSDVIYPIVATSRNDVNQWMQACKRSTADYPTKKVYKLFVNLGEGLPPNSSVTVTLPVFSDLGNEQYITWWNGGRVLLGDRNEGFLDSNIDVPIEIPPGVTCVGDNAVCNLKLYSSDIMPVEHSPAQLSEYTFGDSISPGIGQPRLLNPENVGYNISYVDHVYLPVAIAPKNNPYIGFNGTVQSFADFRRHVDEFVAGIGNGWPVYNMKRPLKLPGAYKAMTDRDGYVPGRDDVPVKPPSKPNPPVLVLPECIDDPVQCGDKIDKTFGEAVQRMQNLWGSCVAWNEDLSKYVTERIDCPEDLKKNMQVVKDFFAQNYEQYASKYNTSECKNPTVPKVVFGYENALQHIYGWVPFNQGCGAAFNPLAETKVRDWDHAKIQPMYIHSLQYNYTSEAVKLNPKLIFNPYVKLIHDDLKMNAYGFSVDDAVGFMSELGDGLIFAVGGPRGLENENAFSYSDGFSVHIGTPLYLVDKRNRSLIKKYRVCSIANSADNPDCAGKPDVIMPENRNIAGFRVGTVDMVGGKPNYPIRVLFTDVDDNLYNIVVQEQFEQCPDDRDIASCPTNKAAIIDKNDPLSCSVTDSKGQPHRESKAWCGPVNANQSRENINKEVSVWDRITKNHISAPQPVDFCVMRGGAGCHE